MTPTPTSGTATAISSNTNNLPQGEVDTAYGATLQATGGKKPYTWSISNGDLPAGLDLDTASGNISGTPRSAGMTSFTVKVSDNSTPPMTDT